MLQEVFLCLKVITELCLLIILLRSNEIKSLFLLDAFSYINNKRNNMFDDKVLLITGGTGSFGNAVLKRFLDSKVAEIRIFSRDEKKQDDMRKNIKILN